MAVVQYAAAKDFFEQQTRTKKATITNNTSAGVIRARISSLFGKHCEPTLDELIKAARELGVAVLQSETNSNTFFGIKALDHELPVAPPTRTDLVCKHGFAPYQFVFDSALGQAVRTPTCTRCMNGLEAPSEAEVQLGVDWIAGKTKTAPSSSGAILEAAKRVGMSITRPTGAKYHVRRVAK